MHLLCGGAQTLTQRFQATFLILFLLCYISRGDLVYLISIKLWLVGYLDIILKALGSFQLAQNINSHSIKTELQHLRSPKQLQGSITTLLVSLLLTVTHFSPSAKPTNASYLNSCRSLAGRTEGLKSCVLSSHILWALRLQEARDCTMILKLKEDGKRAALLQLSHV